MKLSASRKKRLFKFEEIATIKDVKSVIYYSKGIALEDQTISLQGKHFFLHLEDEKTLSDYNIQEKSVLYVFLKEPNNGTLFTY